MHIEHNDKGVTVINRHGVAIHFTFSEFWELCRYGNFIDVRSEVEEYIENCDNINGVNVDEILNNSKLMDDITNEVISVRLSYENGDTIWDAANRLVKRGDK
jgi:hypothetical protein